MRKKRYILTIILTLIFIIIYYFIFTIVKLNAQERIDFKLNNKIINLETHYNVILHNQKITANAIYKSATSMPDIINILSIANGTTDENILAPLRNKFHALIQEQYENIKLQGVLQYHFVTSQNNSFLQMHKAKNLLGDIPIVKEDFIEVNKTLLPVHGFSQEEIAHGFRNTYPIFDTNHNHLGAMEVSFSTQTLQEQLTTVSKIHSHIIFEKSNFDEKVLEINKLILEHLSNTKNQEPIVNNKELPKQSKSNIEAKMLAGEKFVEYIKQVYKNGNTEIFTFAFSPIKETKSNKTVAWIVGYEGKNEAISFILKTSRLIQIFSFIFLFIIFYFLYRIINQKETLAEMVKEKTQTLNAHNRNLENRINKEIERNNIIKDKLYRTEKLSAMTEMIANIAHQWRQPLSVISTGTTGMKIEKEFGLLSDKKFNDTCDLINQNVQYLSKTLEDFNDFIKGTNTIETFLIEDNVKNCLALVLSDIKQQNITVILDIEKDLSIKSSPNLLQQCFINIFNNSKDAFVNTKQENKFFFITAKKEKKKIIIQLKDNAGGIPEEILPKIFNPYFTTKHQSQGTGLGLNLTYNLIVDGMRGTIVAINKEYKYEENEYKGAAFIIELPR